MTMAKSENYTRRAWDDRFQPPTIDQLRDDLPDDTGELFDRMREHLKSLRGIKEGIEWYGPCWRWTLEYRGSGAKDPMALLIPSPEDFQLVMPFDRKVIEAMPVDQMKRAVRDGLDLAREPFDTRWGIWSVQFANLVDDLINVIDLKYKHVHR